MFRAGLLLIIRSHKSRHTVPRYLLQISQLLKIKGLDFNEIFQYLALQNKQFVRRSEFYEI
jgi:hypothetical protein